MPYHPISLPLHTPAVVRDVVRSAVDKYLEEVHWLLCMARPSDTRDQFQRSIAGNLLAVISGIAATLYAKQGEPGKQFAMFFEEYYPWDISPAPPGMSRKGATQVIYKVFRNPIAHTVGMRRRRTKFIKIGSVFKTELGVTKLEISDAPIRPLLVVTKDKTVLWVDTLYWGIRQMVQRLLADPLHGAAAAKWLAENRFDPSFRMRGASRS